ncbi:MAG: ABC transporter permease, partial [Ruminococcus sp.]|nr:ABC transporter permease [Ruminococcus sp.]
MRDPLIKRIPREIRADLGKQLVILLFFTLLISAASGYFIAGDSLIQSYNESFDKYSIEDGNFELYEKADADTIKDIEEDGGITVYENFYKQEETKDFESKLRIFGERNSDEIDGVCLLSGDMPAKDNEIAIDRLYAKNHDLEKGSKIKLDESELTVSGIVAFSDYSCLYESASDLMFDNDKFGVGVMTDEGFDAIRDDHLHYSYSWLYDDKPANDAEAKDAAEQLVKDISKHAVLTNYIPEYTNQAIIFAGNDMGDDMLGMRMFLYITLVILAFITAITTDNTIIEEAGVIGTLRASGYTKSELLRHYLIVPMLTLTLGAILGNVLGYTVMEKYMASAYLGSYSLTTYEVRFNLSALIETTLIPFVIMLVINTVTIASKLKLSPLRFLRHDLSKRGKKKAFRLNTKIPIMIRY